MPPILAQLAQILVAALGGLAFAWLGIPAAWLSGAMIATILWGILGLSRPLPGPMRDAALLISGASMGAAVTPEAIAAVQRYPVSLGILFVGIIATSGASMLWLIHVSRWRTTDAMLASVPGALSMILSVAVERKADIASIAVVQSLRIFILVTLLPSAVVLLGGGQANVLPGQGQPVAAPTSFALILVGGLAVGLIMERVRVAAPILLGATFVSMILHATDMAPGVSPPVIATGGLILIGIFVGERFRHVDRFFLFKTLPSAFGSFTISLGVAALFAALAAWLAGVGYADALVAFAPGALEAMMVLSLVLGLDPLYVGVHHLARFIAIALVVPFLIPRVKGHEDA
jgi:membrane AbrB-like protein